MRIDESLLIESYKNNEPIAKLQKQFGISKSHVYTILKKNNIVRNKFKPETINRENSIIEDYKNGMIIKDILEKYKINDPASVYCILNKKKIKKKFEEKRNIDFDQILKLYNGGKSPREIGEVIGRNRSLIRKLLIENNIKLRENGYFKNQNKNQIIKLYNDGKNISEISRTLNCSGTEIKNILKEKNIIIRNSFPKFQNLDLYKDNIINEYGKKKSSAIIAKEIGCSDVAILDLLKRNNIAIRKIKGESHPAWKGGITPFHVVARECIKNDNWKKLCFEKNKYCSEISYMNKKLQCHHIYPFKNILKSSLMKHKCLENEMLKLALINDSRFFDTENGLIITDDEHKKIEKTKQDCHPYWKVWQAFPEFALKKFDFTEGQYLSFSANGQLDAQDAQVLVSNATTEIKKIIRYEHYLGTIPPHKLILTAQVNGIIAGIAIFGHGANKNIPKDYWELTRLCVPYYVVRHFTIKFLDMCVEYIKNNCPEIQQLISYADPNVDHDGAVYRMSGWGKEGKTKPSYCYFDPNTNQLKHKSCCRRVKGVDKTEIELAQERGLIRISLLPKRKYSICLHNPPPPSR